MNRYFKMPITGRFKDINKVSNGKSEFCSKHGNGANATLMQGVLKALDPALWDLMTELRM